MSLNYQNTLEQALIKLRQLDINKALKLFNQLLNERPQDLDLIARIYHLENRRKNTEDFKNLCHHIFSIDSKSSHFHQLIISTLNDYKQKFERPLEPNQLTHQQIFNLFYHLGITSNEKDTLLLKNHIKKELSENNSTANALFIHCEQLVEKKKLLLAQKELEYLLIYYTEANTTTSAEYLLKKIRQQLNTVNTIPIISQDA